MVELLAKYCVRGIGYVHCNVLAKIQYSRKAGADISTGKSSCVSRISLQRLKLIHQKEITSMSINDIITNGISIMGKPVDLTSFVISITLIIVAIAALCNGLMLCRDSSGFNKKHLECVFKNMMDTKKWDFTTNWVGPVAALLTLVIATQSKAANGQLVSLGLFFGMIMIFAPLLYNTACKMQDDDTSEKPHYKVKVYIFLLTSAISLWAVLGGALTVMLLLEAPMRVESSGLFVFILLMMMVLAVWHNTSSTHELVHKHIDHHLKRELPDS